jgi:NADPH-dependent ferric siderophore reductase
MAVPSQGNDRAGGGRGRTPMTATVLRTERLSPSMIRVVLGGAGLDAFTPNEYSDAYVKLVFLRPGVDYPRPLDLAIIRDRFPAEQWPQQRTYTVRAWAAETRELTVDFVVHGDEGLAGPWAQAARPGDEMVLLGPSGGYAPDPLAGRHLLVGDESALPAIAASLERLPVAAVGDVFVEVEDAAHEQPLRAPEGVSVNWVHQDGRPPGDALLDAVSALDLAPADVQAFVHGEAGVVRRLRRLLRQERGLPLERLSISGYWRLGADDEGWRAIKREWNAAIEKAEAEVG